MRKLLLLLSLTAIGTLLSARQQQGCQVVGVARKALLEQSMRQESPKSRKVTKVHRCLTAFVQTFSSNDIALLHQLGCQVHAQTGNVAIATIPLSVLPKLAAHPSVRRIEAGPSAHTTMDITPQAVNVVPAYQTTSRHQAFTGKDVVIGMVDVGFDMTHPTFFDASDGHFRVGAFWDQVSPDTVGSSLPVGRDFVGPDAVLTVAHATDATLLHHANHTTGIAAGSALGAPYRGIAYESELCLVNNAVTNDTVLINPDDHYKYTTATDALAFKYAFDYADSRKLPCVVSFSEGYAPFYDNEDSLYATFIDSLTTIPGHIFVASAGNESLKRTYLPKPVGTAEAGSFLIFSGREAVMTLKADGPLTLVLHSYAGNQVSPSHHAYSSFDAWLDSILVDTLVVGTDTCTIALDRYPMAMAGRADTVYTLRLKSAADLGAFLPMALTIEATATQAECFANTHCSFTEDALEPRWNAALTGRNVFAPGCFPASICVGATSHRGSVSNYRGETVSLGTMASDKLVASYSSTGPAMNGQLKPDVVAPGSNIVSAYSRYYLDHHPEEDTYAIGFTSFNGKEHPWVLSTGTSMSTPVVSGAIALWLQANPRLTQHEVKQVLSRTCTHPTEDLSYPNNSYGWGEIDVYRGLLYVLGLDAVGSLSTHQPLEASILPHNGGLKLVFNEAYTGQLDLRMYTLGGNCVLQTSLQADGTQLTVPLPTLAPGVYAVQLNSQKDALRGSQLVRL